MTFIKTEYLHSELTSKIIKCAMNIHSDFGNGFQETIYQRCLAIEFKENNIDFVREKEMDLYYKNKNVGTRRVDFLVENKIIVELNHGQIVEFCLFIPIIYPKHSNANSNSFSGKSFIFSI